MDGDKSYDRHTHTYSDGSVENDLPMQQISELFNVNHFIVRWVKAMQFNFSCCPFYWLYCRHAFSLPSYVCVCAFSSSLLLCILYVLLVK